MTMPCVGLCLCKHTHTHTHGAALVRGSSPIRVKDTGRCELHSCESDMRQLANLHTVTHVRY